MKELIIQTSRLLYQNKVEEGYAKMKEVFTHIISYMNSQSPEKIMVMNQVLSEALKAMEEKDAVLLADILRYELIPELQ